MTGQSAFRAPSRALLWSEQLRATAETVGYFAALPALTLGPSGDGHHVLVIPGLMASDASTAGLRHVLRQRGYQAHGWRLGTNIGPTRHIHTGVVDRLAELAERGGAPVTIIGWSLGGIIARQLARMAPDQVRNVITLGSPFRLTLNDRPDVTHAHRIFEAFRPWHTNMLDTGHLPEDERPPLTVPSTAIYSRLDGVVPWQACMNVAGPQAESIEVTASHIGLGVDPRTLAVVLDRVGQPAGAWQPYAARTARAC